MIPIFVVEIKHLENPDKKAVALSGVDECKLRTNTRRR